MYGLVNKAVVDLVVSKFGEDTWNAIKKKAEVDIDVFVSMDGYPDELTYKLVGAASDTAVRHANAAFRSADISNSFSPACCR